jgi:hypothetical protein
VITTDATETIEFKTTPVSRQQSSTHWILEREAKKEYPPKFPQSSDVSSFSIADFPPSLGSSLATMLEWLVEKVHYKYLDELTNEFESNLKTLQDTLRNIELTVTPFGQGIKKETESLQISKESFYDSREDIEVEHDIEMAFQPKATRKVTLKIVIRRRANFEPGPIELEVDP